MFVLRGKFGISGFDGAWSRHGLLVARRKGVVQEEEKFLRLVEKGKLPNLCWSLPMIIKGDER
jgi:hypothetical protein